jgi:hypothetical protein
MSQEINLEKRVMLKLIQHGGKHSGENKWKRYKKVDTFVYLGSMAEKNDKIQNEINERSVKASKCYYSANIKPCIFDKIHIFPS